MSQTRTPATGAAGRDGPDDEGTGAILEPGRSGLQRGREYTVSAGEWQDLPEAVEDDLMVINMGPQHPSTHGVLRMVLTLAGEIVVDNQPVIGYLHTGIEKNTEYRPWTQGVTFVTRMDYLSPLFNELGFCLAVERLLGIEDQVPERAQVIRVIMTELNRISSHMVWLATSGMELGAMSVMLYGFRERESILDIFEFVTGLRMNHGYIRPGGVSMDVPTDFAERVGVVLREMPRRMDEFAALLEDNPIWIERNKGIGILTPEQCLDLGVTGPILRAAGIPYDLRKAEPYCGIDQYDFDVVTTDTGDAYGRYLVRSQEVLESLKIIEQGLDALPDGPVMVADKKIGWPAQLALGPDGLGNAEEYIGKIMGQSMEALIHHFKLVTEGFTVPAGQVYCAVESARGELGYHVTSNGTNKPYRVRVRDPSLLHIGALPTMSRGLYVADIIATLASIDPVIGGADR
ncbi:MAG TPA: NADH-quinone oxidoreductase subunit D [Egibacteraceae bacterium]|nr:NADH-quinone oxidoreductase subunit D [Actinomycetota bacterium]HWB72327.1 NADH-quinone oxidoreductase subunit D [Egibacteraceae bacterium]